METDINWTHEREVLRGIDAPDNAVVYCICNYPSDKVYEAVDYYCPQLRPPYHLWDDYILQGDKGYGWHKFKGKYLVYLNESNRAYRAAQQLRARGFVRPVYICHHYREEEHSPAMVCTRFISDVVELSVEQDQTRINRYD